MNPITEQVIEALSQDTSERIVACTYTWAFRNRACVSAGFRIAKQRGIIEVAYTGAQGNPVYRRVAR